MKIKFIELCILRPTIIFLIILVLPYYLATYLDAYLSLPKVFTYPINLFGLVLVFAGILLDVLTVKEFLKAKGTPTPWRPPNKLLVTGPYRYTRNPIYLSWSLMMAGIGIFSNAPAIFMLIPVFMAAVQFGIVMFEERELERTYGKKYLQYKKKVSRWLPNL